MNEGKDAVHNNSTEEIKAEDDLPELFLNPSSSLENTNEDGVKNNSTKEPKAADHEKTIFLSSSSETTIEYSIEYYCGVRNEEVEGPKAEDNQPESALNTPQNDEIFFQNLLSYFQKLKENNKMKLKSQFLQLILQYKNEADSVDVAAPSPVISSKPTSSTQSPIPKKRKSSCDQM